MLGAVQCIYLFSYPFLFNVNCRVNRKSLIATECTKLLRLWNVEMVTRFRQFFHIIYFRHTHLYLDSYNMNFIERKVIMHNIEN